MTKKPAEKQVLPHLIPFNFLLESIGGIVRKSKLKCDWFVRFSNYLRIFAAKL
ncbi:MAG: hypothetical protein IJT30_06100 [Muribaculaceae bacterium]|nr:hypothetical protein [Muribaculaceae bacterium]